MCEWFDETVGELLEGLDKNGLRKNPLVVFVVDNGWVQATGPGRRATSSARAEEHALRRRPAHAGAAALAGPHESRPVRGPRLDHRRRADHPRRLRPEPARDDARREPARHRGRARGALERDAVFGEIYVHTAMKLEDPRANLTHRWVRDGDWKLIVPVKADGKPELYDLADDPFEKSNRAAAKQEKVKELKQRLNQAWELGTAK